MQLIEIYKDHQIWNDNGAIAINKSTDGQDYLFYVGYDDSKTDGAKHFYNSFNTTEAAKSYIDWKTEPDK